MHTSEQIEAYINAQPGAKCQDMQVLHQLILGLMPGCQLWYLDGKDAKGKTVTNPNIGYGSYTLSYADGSSKEFYRIGLSGNTTGISVYLMGLPDKKYLPDTYGSTIGRANVTGYCIKFKALKDIRLEVLTAAIKFASRING